MSKSPLPFLQPPASFVSLEEDPPPPPPSLSRSPRLPRRRNNGDGVFLSLFSPRPQTQHRNPFAPGSQDASNDGKSATLRKNRHQHRAIAVAAISLRSVNERIYAPSPGNPAAGTPSIRKHLHKQKQCFSRLKFKFLQKLFPATSPRPCPHPRPSSKTSCPFPSAKPGLQVAHVPVVEKENGSSRSRCSLKQSAPPRPGALDYAWAPVVLLGLCFGFSAAILLVVCWFYLFPVITRVSEFRRLRSAPEAQRTKNNHGFRLS